MAKQGVNFDYDLVAELARKHSDVRLFKQRTLVCNVVLLSPQLLEKVSLECKYPCVKWS